MKGEEDGEEAMMSAYFARMLRKLLSGRAGINDTVLLPFLKKWTRKRGNGWSKGTTSDGSVTKGKLLDLSFG